MPLENFDAPRLYVDSPLAPGAALQLDAAIPNFLIQESIYKSRGFFDELLEEPFKWQEGDLIVDDRPGLGVALNEAALLEHHA